jgi:hypothetical protein
MIRALIEGWRNERADMLKVLGYMGLYVAILGGGLLALVLSGYPELAALMGAYFIGDFCGYARGRRHGRERERIG